MFLPRLLVLLFAPFAVVSAATAPAVTGATATPGADGAVTLNATVTANGALTSVVFEYGKSAPAYGKSAAGGFVSADGVAVPISATVTGLIGGRTYHFRVVASNDAGVTRTSDATFDVPAYTPALTILKATDVVADRATLRATITSNGTTGTALFQYTSDTTFGTPGEVTVQTIDGTEEALALSAPVSALERNKTYRFRLILRTASSDLPSNPETFLTNQIPIARADTFHLTRLRPTSVDVLKNDSDKDGAVDPLKVLSTSSAAKGIATPTADGLRVVYSPGSTFRGTDAFTYTITDGFPASTAAASVTIRSFGTLLAGNHGGILVDENGEAIGYFKITTTGTGTFSGSVRVNGVKESFAGAFGADGKFRGTIEIDGRSVPLALAATVSGDATTVDVDFDDGRWRAALHTSEASADLRAEHAGRYTVEFPSGTSTSDPASEGGDPAGSGWAVVKLGDDGVARVKGRLPDGRSFSTRGVFGVSSEGPVVTFFDDPRRTRVAAALRLDDAVTGTLGIVRDSGGSGDFSGGYTLQSTASGARYVPPADGKRAIEGDAGASGRRLTFSATGTDPAETFTRELRVSEDDEVDVVDRDSERLTVKIDRDSGRFTAWFTGSTENQRFKGTGVFIQGTSSAAAGRGAGVFKGENGTGKMTISAGGGTTTDSGTTDSATADPAR